MRTDKVNYSVNKSSRNLRFSLGAGSLEVGVEVEGPDGGGRGLQLLHTRALTLNVVIVTYASNTY